MRYWGYFVAKLAVVGALLFVLLGFIRYTFLVYFGMRGNLFAHDLAYTSIMMVFFMLCIGAIYLVVWDQRYRCRTCLRRLRMPVSAGSWPNMFLIGRPRTEYICLYGHGTLKIPEEQITGSGASDWEPHADIWRELESLEESTK
jgi:hypothetical protein